MGPVHPLNEVICKLTVVFSGDTPDLSGRLIRKGTLEVEEYCLPPVPENIKHQDKEKIRNKMKYRQWEQSDQPDKTIDQVKEYSIH